MWGSYCAYCGDFFNDKIFPKKCSNGHITYLHPKLLGVALQPVVHRDETKLLVLERGIDPFIGQLALPGGFLDVKETPLDAAVRELFEETGIKHTRGKPHIFSQLIGNMRPDLDPRDDLLQFVLMPKLDIEEVDMSFVGNETRALSLIKYSHKKKALVDQAEKNVQLCFPLHNQAALVYLSRYD
jgi:ADP-ribose pyrophosphatase YjhB (NUDIX family)